MKTPVMTEKKRSLLFGVLGFVAFFSCFIFAPVGSFLVWIFGGTSVYLLFLAIYSLVPAEKKQLVRARYDRRQAETKAYIAFHKPILIAVFFAGLLLVIVILMAVL